MGRWRKEKLLYTYGESLQCFLDVGLRSADLFYKNGNYNLDVFRQVILVDLDFTHLWNYKWHP